MRSVQGKYLVSIWLSLCLLNVSAQDVRLRSGFIQDSLGVGEPVQYWLAATYPVELEVLFPDSTYNFSPFEYTDKRYEPTIVTADMARDTAVYTLQSFDIDPVQYLDLPVIVFRGPDSVTFRSTQDSIFFRELVPVASDTTLMKVNTRFLDVDFLVNYPLLWIILGSLLVVGLLIMLIFGKKIRRSLRIRRLRKEYAKFSEQLSHYIQDLRNRQEPELAEEAVSFWKKYYEKLESRPYSKLTTSEILQYDHTAELKDALKAIDRSIYGHIQDQSLYKNFQSIEDFTQHRYHLKLEKLKDGS